MGDFKFAQAALAGVELVRRRPTAVLSFWLAGALISFGGRLAAILSTHFQTFKGTSPPVAATYTALVMLLLSAGVIAMIGAAVARLAARPDARGTGLRLGGDEARLFLLSLLIFPALIVVMIGLAFGAAASVAIGARLNEDAVMTVGAAIGVIAACGLFSRLWPAGAMTVQAEAMRLRGAWRLTRKRPWKIFALFCLATALGALIGIGANIALSNSLAKWPRMGWTAYLPFEAALQSGFHPLQLAHLLAQGLLFGLGVFVQVAPATTILAALAEDRGADQAAVFD